MSRCDHGFERSVVPCPVCDSRKSKAPLPMSLKGLKIGKLTGIDLAPGEQSVWLLKCECGEVVTMNRRSLRKSFQFGHVSACPRCRAFTKPHEAQSLCKEIAT